MPSPAPTADAATTPVSMPPGARILVLVSSDYGELGAALYFLDGLPPETAVTLLLPPALLASARSHAGPEMAAYRGADDVMQAIERDRPAAVLLFCGSLLALGTGLGLRAVLRLLRSLRQQGIPILTSDPFAGLVRGPASLRFAPAIQGIRSAVRRRLWAWRLACTVAFLQRRLRDAWTLYPAALERHPGPGTERRVTFFNPHALARARAVPIGHPPAWVFVLSQVDCHIESNRLGDAFYLQLAQRLADAVRLGRRAVLVAPAPVLQRLRALPQPPPADMIATAAYDDFLEQLLAAEYAFFWNYYSFSIMHRVLAGRPVFFFGEGHMVRILPALQEGGIRLFYGGWRPPLLPFGAELREPELAALAAQTCAQFGHLVAALQRCAPPALILQRVLSADQRDVHQPLA